MRILVLCYEYPPLGGGGGRVAAQVATALAARDHEVQVVTAGMSHLPYHVFVDDVEVVRVRAGRRHEDRCSVIEMFLWVMTVLPVAFYYALKRKPDVIHAHFAVPTGLVAWILHLLTKIPYVITAHLGDVPGGVPEQTGSLFNIIKPFTNPIWKKAARVTAVSSFVAELAEQAYEITPKVILNGVTLPSVVPEKKGTMPQLLMVGRLSVQKNPLLAIKSLALLKKIPWTLKIIGDGPLLSSLKNEIKKQHLEERVKIIGWASSDEVQAAMAASDILLMPSLSEGLPMAGVEALAYGLAIVGSRIGGLQDVVEEGKNGALFDLEGDAEAMAGALGPFLDDMKLLRNAQVASREKAKVFELSHSIKQYEKILKSAAFVKE